MNKEFYDKYQKELDCKSCIGLQECSTNSNIPLCDKGYRRFAKDKIAELEQQLTGKDKEIEELKTKQELTFMHSKEDYFQRCNLLAEENIKLQFAQTQLAIQELEKVNGILTDTIIEVTRDEFDLNKLCYLEEISAKFYEKIHKQISELKGE